jgi:tetratricopeptide (TPR) repeat protein
MSPARSARQSLVCVCVCVCALLASAVTSGGAARAEVGGETTQLADAELERMLAPLYGDDAEARRAAAASVENLGADATTAIGKKLAEERKASTSSVGVAIKAARDEAPKTAGEIELGDALLRTKTDGPGYRAAVTIVALIRALAHVGTTPALRQMVRVALDHGGAFRPEIARQVKTLGDKAVPALIETRKESSSELRHWAYSQLESMGKRVPGDAVQTKNNQVLADVLHAFALVHDMDALPVILSFVNSDRIQVRGAAREALGEFGQDAIWKLREAYGNVTGKPAPETWTAAEVQKELFTAYDRLRNQEVYGLLDEGLARDKEGKLEEAVAAFDKVLARQPMLDRRAEMVPTYVAYATKLEPTDPPKSLALFRKAMRLWPDTPRRPQVEAEIAYLEGKELLGRGIADVEPFRRALRLDPSHEAARAELNRLETNVEEREERIRALAAAAAVVVVAIIGILLFGGRPRRRALRA